jgi:hypothetical protein
MNRTGYHWELFTYLTNVFIPANLPKTKFIIFTIGRSGSSLLVSLLKSNPEIHCVGELLGKKLLFPERYIHQVAKRFKKGVFGFKLNTYHFRVQNIQDPVAFVGKLSESGYKIISLQRDNFLRQVISHMYAVYRGKYHQKASEGQQKQPQITIELDVLKKELRLFEGYQALEKQILGQFPHFALSYEKDLAEEARQQETVNRVAAFLDTPPAPVSTDLVKTTPKELSRIIHNYEEVRQYLQNTPYAEFLDDS